ncbi:hypothetical protein EON82_13220 [bacterium]|nr:MAG: hypothetical protein EON82_13220 [bacterium]
MAKGGGSTKVWTTGRKWAGNLVPFAIWLPFTVAGVWTIVRDRAVTPTGVGLLALGVVLGWVGLSLFGFWGNAAMRRLLEARIKEKEHRWFVGFASPKFTGVLDAHEDVGFLIFRKDALVFAGDSRRVEMPKDSVVRVVFRPNVHTVVGLGRWVCVEGVVKGQPVRMFVEPRERPTMLGNLRLSSKLRAEIETWMKTK